MFFGGIHFPIYKIQYDILVSMQWPSHYNHLVYRVPPASVYERFLKLLSILKACSDLGKGTAVSWNLYLSLLFPISD